MHIIPFQTLTEAIMAASPEQPFITIWNDEDDIQTVTFGQFLHQAQTQAVHFHTHGLSSGDTVILIMPQAIPLMTAFVGAMLLGAIPAILAYPNFKVEPAKYRSGLAGVSANLKARLVVIDDAFPPEWLDHVTLNDGTQLIHSGAMPLRPNKSPDVSLEAESLAFIQHSAGTTGLQKGVALSHAAVLRQLNHLAAVLQINDQDRLYSWLPLYHDMGLIACFMLPLTCHLPIVMQSPTNWVMQPATMLQLISEYRCTLAWMPNFALQFVARRVRPADRASYKLSSLRVLINCSEPVRAQSMDEFRDAFELCGLKPNVLQSSYAMAENVFAVTQSGINGQLEPCRIWVDGECLRNEHIAVPIEETKKGAMLLISSGQCLPGNSVRIVSADGHALPDGTIGEILIRSDSLFDGYYNRPDLTEKTLQNGWYWSGDLGFCLNGELYVTGRKKDMIIVGGKNIYPQDVENIAFRHPAIHDGRAIALNVFNPDLGTEDIIVVAEVKNADNLNEAFTIERTVRNAVVAELNVAVRAVYLKPRQWLVKSTAGKPARSATLEKLLTEHPELEQR